MEARQISDLIEKEFGKCSDPKAIALIRELLVSPRCQKRPWDYGKKGDTYPCWIVAEHRASNTAFVYCEDGFGPKCPWGLLWISGDNLSMGMDSSWFTSLEAAVKDSFAWEERK